MAVNESRSMRRSLLIGTTEGAYKQSGWDGPTNAAITDNSDTVSNRSGLDAERYGGMVSLPLEARHIPGGRY